MRIKKRYDEYSTNETIEENRVKKRADNAKFIVLLIIDIALWAIPVYLSFAIGRGCMEALMGAFFFSFGLGHLKTGGKKISSFIMMAYGVVASVINIIYFDKESLALPLFMTGWVLLVLCSAANRKPNETNFENEEFAKKKKNYRKSSHDGLFINDPTKYDLNSFGDLNNAISDIKRQEYIEKTQNNGKMISDSNISFFSNMPEEKKSELKAAIISSVVGGILLLPAIFCQCAGIVIGVVFIMWGRLFTSKPSGTSVYSQNFSKYLGRSILISGALTILCNIFFRGDTATPVCVAASFFIVTAGLILANGKNTEHTLKNANELIQAVCVDVAEIATSERGYNGFRYYPVFEIEYKGMYKRLRARIPYPDPPEIGVRRIIYINPDNLDEWYDPQNMSSYGI